jgi:hypothetical protein
MRYLVQKCASGAEDASPCHTRATPGTAPTRVENTARQSVKDRLDARQLESIPRSFSETPEHPRGVTQKTNTSMPRSVGVMFVSACVYSKNHILAA